VKDAPKIPRYEQFALVVEEQIRSGTFPMGARLPSIREAIAQHRVSFSTALQAYRHLEDRGIIEARPQSGYYVKVRPAKAVAEPEFSPLQGDPTSVTIDEVSVRLIHDTLNQDFAQFGAALPDPALLPTAKLSRILSQLGRDGKFSHVHGEAIAGQEDLRIQIAQRAFGYGCDLSPGELVVTAGCTEAMCLCLQAVCRPGDLVAIESPTYFGIILALEALHLRALEIPSHPRTGMSLDALKFAVDNYPVKAVLAIPNFGNPSGSLMTDADKRDLVEFLAGQGIPLIENDINGELHFSERRPRPAKAFDREGFVMLCSSYSKDISIWFRLGWVAPGRFFREVQSKKYAMSVRTSILPELAVARFLESGGYDAHLRKIRAAYARKASLLAQAIGTHFPEGTRVIEPAGGFVMWVQLPHRLDSLELYREAQKAFITLAPGYIFSPTHKFNDFIRLNAACWSDHTEQDVIRLGKVTANLLRAKR
jgi:DNA-binding transcriptional MocR family regulator